MTSYVVFVRIIGERAYSFRVDNASDGGHARDVVRKIVADTLEIQGAYNPEEVIYDAILDANGTTMEATIVQHLGTSSLPREAPS